MPRTSEPRPSRLIQQNPERPKRANRPRPVRPAPAPSGGRNTYRGRRQEPKKPWWGRGRNSYRRSPRREPRRSWWKPVLLAAGLMGMVALCLGLVVLYHHLLTCSLFCIKDINNIEIEGTKRLTREYLLERARLTPEINLLALRPGQVERALLTHPWIARAEVTRIWPQRLHLKIEERDPVALAQVGEELFYVDRQGVLFKPMSPGDPHNYPVLTGLTQEHFTQVEGAPPEVVTQAFQLLEVLKGAAPPLNLENISEIHVDLERGFTIYLNGLGGGLELGFKDYSEKLKKFAQLWPVLAQKGYLAKVGRINLNYPQRVLITLKGGEERTE